MALSRVPEQAQSEAFGPADVAELICLLILDDFAYELHAAIAEPFKRLVNVIHGEHDAQIAQSIDWGVAVIATAGSVRQWDSLSWV